MANIYDPSMLRAFDWYVYQGLLENSPGIGDSVLWFPVEPGTVLDISRPSAQTTEFRPHWTSETPAHMTPTTAAAPDAGSALALPTLTVPAGVTYCVVNLGVNVDPATFSLVIEDNITAPPPDPDPEPVPTTPGITPQGQAVADFIGGGDNDAFAVLCSQHAAIVTALARSYCRGGGFTPDGPREDVAAVITTASARMVANPEQSTIQAGEVSGRDRGFQGWNLAELAVLNRYRGRAA